MQTQTKAAPAQVVTPEQVLDFWMSAGPQGWYLSDPAFDDQIRAQFEPTWHAAHAGAMPPWAKSAEGALALLILLDQFPRNMFRGHGDSFATDSAARRLAKKAIDQSWDMRIPEPQRQFFYLPLMHSECLVDQDRCVRLVLTRMPDTGANTLPHARAHREVIRDFGRFPYRNDALGRKSRPDEVSYLELGGYAHTLRSLTAPS